MRITGGEFSSRRIEVPNEGKTRPSTDRLREALYSALAARVDLEGIQVLDLYSGSGALAFEALSRGAARATCVESDRKAAAVITRNAATLGVSEKLDLRVGNAIETAASLSSQGKRFGLVVADPPYGDEAGLLLRALADSAVLLAEGLMVIEYSRRDALPESLGNLRQLFSRNYGDSALAIYSLVDEDA
jgi:16S rRNA (guanine966-N2)-methyltransferase